MGNLILDYDDDNDIRKDVVIDVPPPPPPQEPEPEKYAPSAETEQLLSDPGNPLMDFQASDMPEFENIQAPAPLAPTDINVPDYSPFERGDVTSPNYSPFDGATANPGGMSAVDMFSANQDEREKKSFLNALDTNSVELLTSGETFPTLYEGATQSDISALNRRALDLSRQSFEQAKQQQNQDLLKPIPAQRVDLAKPNFNSDRSAFWGIPGMIGNVFNSKQMQSFGRFIGVTDTSQEFNPVAGVKPYIDGIRKDPWKIVTLPLAPAIITAQGKFGENGDGWFGGTVYALSLPENIVMGGLTDLHNLITGNKDPQNNRPAIAQAIMGGSFDFTQPASKHRPLSFIGSDKTPKTITELQNRGGLGKLLLNPWTWDAARWISKKTRGTENISIPDFKYVDPSTNELKTVPAGKAIQGVETGAGFVADMVKGFGSDLVVDFLRTGRRTATIQKSKPAGALPPQATPIYPKPIQPTPTPPTPSYTRIPVTVTDITNQMPPLPTVEPIKLLAPAIKTPNLPKDLPELEVFINPISRAPKPQGMPVITPRQLLPAKDADELIKEISVAPIGTTVDIESLVTVERSAEELTEVAKLLGDVPASRSKPLSRARLNELAKLYDPTLNPYKIHGSPIDIDAFRSTQKVIEVEPGTVAEIVDAVPLLPPAIDIPMPKSTQGILEEIAKREPIIKSAEVPDDVKYQVASELDSLYDNLYDVRDITDPSALAETIRNVPSEMATSSQDGLPLLQEALINEKIFEEVAEAEQVLKPILLNSQNELIKNIEAVEQLPALGRSSALKASPFEPSPVRDIVEDVRTLDNVSEDGKFVTIDGKEYAIEGRDMRLPPSKDIIAGTPEVEQLAQELDEVATINGRPYSSAGEGYERVSWFEWAQNLEREAKVAAWKEQNNIGIKTADEIAAMRTPSAPPPEVPLKTTDPNAIRRTTNEDRILNAMPELETGDSSLVSIEQLQAKFPKMSPEKLQASVLKLQDEGLITVDGTGAIERTIPTSTGGTYYHGTQVRDLNLMTIDPLLGGSRNELGVGIYITTNKELAENSAKAMPQVNLPPLEGREFDEIGQVFEVYPDVVKPIIASSPPPISAHNAFMEAVRLSQPDDVYRTVRKKLGKDPSKPFNKYFTTLDESILARIGAIDEVDVLQTQRLISDNLRVAGYDAIDDGDVMVLLGGKANNSIGYTESLGQVGMGGLLEGAAARYNVAQITAKKYPSSKVLEVQAREAGVQLQTEITKRTASMYEDAVSRAEDVAYSVSRSQDELEEFVRSEKKVKREQRQRIAEQKNKNQIQNDSHPDTNHCI